MTETPNVDPHEERILILAPSRRDAPTVAAILQKAGLVAEICPDLRRLCSALQQGAGAALIAEEALADDAGTALLLTHLDRQPPWSEPPIVVVRAALHGALRNGFGRISGYGNIVLLERPFRSATLVSAMHSGLRARRRQYQVRDHLRERQNTEERLREQERELRRLNETLEQRVVERTAELEDANRRLMTEMQQRQQAEQALRQAQKMEAIGQITGGVAHDFNNLLMVVSGGINLLERTHDPERRERIVTGIRQAAARGEALTRQLLAFSRRMALSPEAVDLGQLLEGMGILVAGALRQDITIEVNVPDDLWPLMADPAQLDLAILNAAVNARDAMPNGGTLVIEASNARLNGENGLRGDFVRIEVRDTGTGIPSEILDRVFDPFFTTKGVGKGTGLGLSQVYGFAKQSGGQAEIKSRAGEGTSIILHLPRAPAAVAEVHSKHSTLEDHRRVIGGNRRVLLVEDDDGVAVMVREMLEGFGFVVDRVSNAPDALAALNNGHPVHLVFSDIVMPGGMSGIDLARKMKHLYPNIPVILTTGYSGTLPGREDMDGIQILQKPYAQTALEAVLRETWERRAAGPHTSH
jgi:signal transduction histidine kinase/ActR/RegA family two-component response regulator